MASLNGMGVSRIHTERNREIISAFDAGASAEQLSIIHAISLARVRDILYDEKHRREASPDPFYRQLRGSRASCV
jgi:hypothetical protein